MGLAAPGEGYRVVREGIAEIGGRLPVNPSGGLKSRGAPDRGDRRVAARHGLPCNLPGRPARCRSRRGARGRVQHGRGRRRQLRLDLVSAANDPRSQDRRVPRPRGGAESGVAPVSRRVMNLSHLMRRAARRQPDAVGLVWGETDMDLGRAGPAHRRDGRRPRGARRWPRATGCWCSRRTAPDVRVDVRVLPPRRRLGADELPPDPGARSRTWPRPAGPRP